MDKITENEIERLTKLYDELNLILTMYGCSDSDHAYLAGIVARLIRRMKKDASAKNKRKERLMLDLSTITNKGE